MSIFCSIFKKTLLFHPRGIFVHKAGTGTGSSRRILFCGRSLNVFFFFQKHTSPLSLTSYLVRILLRFRWLNKLGLAAQHGYKVIIRQSMFRGEYSLLGQDLEPNPVSLLALTYSHHAFINL